MVTKVREQGSNGHQMYKFEHLFISQYIRNLFTLGVISEQHQKRCMKLSQIFSLFSLLSNWRHSFLSGRKSFLPIPNNPTFYIQISQIPVPASFPILTPDWLQ